MGVVYECDIRETISSRRLEDPAAPRRVIAPSIQGGVVSLADIHHENLVRFGELLAHGPQYFFTMELLSGVDFSAYVRPGTAAPSIERDTTERAQPTYFAASAQRAERSSAMFC